MKRILFFFIFFSVCADPGRERSVGCMDGIRARFAQIRFERRQRTSEVPTPCCLLPTRILQAMRCRAYRAFNN